FYCNNQLFECLQTSDTFSPDMGFVDRFGYTIRYKNDENSDQVTNMFKDKMYVDVHELFKLSGHITHVYLDMDQKTRVSRGFGFVNFINREDPQRYINKLNSCVYHNHILRVEWATPV
ncbi:hypothetical protein KI387_026865, partial [Taxus chinensis]